MKWFANTPAFKTYCRKVIAIAASLSIVVTPSVSFSIPQGGVIGAGSATISSNGNTVTIHQQTDRTVIDWRGFDIAPGETTQFVQPNSNALAVNRVNSNSPSVIDGKLSANGNVMVINPNGMIFGAQARVDVNGLIASTADAENAALMRDGKLALGKTGNPNAAIINQGVITARDGGSIGIIAPNISNDGVIIAKLGKVQLASGDTATVDFVGDGLIEAAVSDSVKSQLIENHGIIAAQGGTIAITSAGGDHIVDSLINLDGVIDATAVDAKAGEIKVVAEGSHAVKGDIAPVKGGRQGTSKVVVSGTLNASGPKTAQKGGAITVTGDHVTLKDGSRVLASGANGGGTVRIGGDYQGKGATPRAAKTTIEKGARIEADANQRGNGGKVIVWADDHTNFAGDISAHGGALSGDGGFVETSGKHMLDATGTVSASAVKGNAGTWLLDPADVVISAGADANNTGNPNFVPNGAASVINTTTIKNVLDAGTNVTVTTGGDAFAGNGDITVSNAITTTGTGSLTLSAFRNISLGPGASITLQGGALTLRSDNANNNSGSITVGAAISTNGGDVTMGGGNGIITAGSGFAVGNASYGIALYSPVNAGGGNIILNGRGFNTTTNTNSGVQVNANLTTSGAGTIQITGQGGGGSVDSAGNAGISVGGTISSANGDIRLNGTGGGAGLGGVNDGVVVTNNTVQTTGAGNIFITGVGGNNAGGTDNNNGIYVNGGFIQTLGTGGITLDGTGGANGVAGSGSRNYGVVTNKTISSNGGAITITGQGGGGNWNNGGVSVSGNTGISNTGTGTVTINATGGGSAAGTVNQGLQISGTGKITTVDGNISVNATGGLGYGEGVSVGGNGINATGNGKINITATATSGISAGIYASAANGISTVNGDLTITGTATNTGGTGVIAAGANAITSSGSGNIRVTGTGASNAAGTGNSYGVVVTGAQGISAAGTGTITVTGTGGSNSGGSNIGVYANGGTIAGNGGLVTVNGTGGVGTSLSHGVFVSGATAAITNVGSGAITINATGSGGTVGSNYGLNVNSGSAISTADGDITIDATGGGAGAGNWNYGLSVSGANAAIKTTGTGNINITATGGNGTGSGSNNHGVYLAAANAIQTLGTGSMTITGTGSASSGGANRGIQLLGGSITGGGGAMTITGNGGNNSGNGNQGVEVTTAGSAITNSGNGSLAVIGNGRGTVNSNTDYGVSVSSGGVVSTVGGDLTVTGTGGGAGVGVNNHGVYVQGVGSTMTTTGSGKLVVNGIAGVNSTGVNIAIANGLQTTGSGNITVNADSLTLNAANNINSIGTLTVAPYTVTKALNLVAGAGGLDISNTYLGYMNAASFVFGRSDGQGLVNAGAFNWTRPLTLQNGTGGITIAGAQNMGANTFLARTFGASDITLNAGSTITSTAAGSAITLATGRNVVNNNGAGALNPTLDRWLIYFLSDTNTANNLTADFVKYGCPYATCGLPATGNGFLYASNATSGGSGGWSGGTIPAPTPPLVTAPAPLPPAVTQPPVTIAEPPSVPTPEIRGQDTDLPVTVERTIQGVNLPAVTAPGDVPAPASAASDKSPQTKNVGSNQEERSIQSQQTWFWLIRFDPRLVKLLELPESMLWF